MLTIEKLEQYGANTNEAINRCMGNKDLYLRLVMLVFEDDNFDKLQKAINNDNLQEAFEAAHALKGILGNLSLGKMYDKSVEITELLRNKTKMDYHPLLNELLNYKKELEELTK